MTMVKILNRVNERKIADPCLRINNLLIFSDRFRLLVAAFMMDVSAGDDDVSFRLGEMFDSYEELEQKLDRVSKHTLVHYWRRDSRTVSGAHMKTARPISERLKYYSVKYACIYGGQKFLPRGAGRRQSQLVSNCFLE